MSDWSLDASLILAFGRQGSGKNTFVYRYLLNAVTVQDANPDPAACVFILDWKLEASRRLGIPAITTEHGFEQALASRWVLFNPHPMFPGDTYVKNPEGKEVLNDQKQALRWFCKRVFECAQRGPGKKIVYIDEPRQSGVNQFYVPSELARIVRTGRCEHIEFISSTQYPRDFHSDIRGAVTEWVCFNTVEPDQLEAVQPYYAQVEKISTLQKGQFIAYNVNSGSELAGRLF